MENSGDEKSETEIEQVLGPNENQKLNLTEDLIDQRDVKIVKETDEYEDPLQLVEFKNEDKEVSELDESASMLRDDNQDDILKRKIYKQALNINNVSLVTPKMQRIHEGVSKVFGIDDPPPGFGLIYPKFYYLEQKRPQPMSPLKVWRGFNGNIYFEPIQLQKQESNSVELPPIEKPVEKFALPSIHRKSKEELKYAKLNKVESTSINSKNVTESLNLNPTYEPNTTELGLDDSNTQDPDEKYFFSTYNQENFTHTENLTAMAGSSMNAFMNSRKFINKPNYQQNNMNDSKLDFNPPNTEMMLTTSNNFKKRIGSAENQKQAILPNLNAVRRHNIPLKGLAFREAKSRINFSSSNEHLINAEISQQLKSETTASLAYYTYQNSKTLPEEYFRNFNINQNTINSSYIEDAAKMGNTNSQNKKTVKEIFRGIRRGVTIMNHMSHSADPSCNFSEKLELNRKSAKQRSTRENLKNLKILNVKGDRITSFEILNSVEPYSSGKKLSKTRIDQSLKTNVKPSAYLSTSNLSFKSNMSAKSIGVGRNITFRNTTPEIS